jgi:hypothetical protein
VQPGQERQQPGELAGVELALEGVAVAAADGQVVEGVTAAAGRRRAVVDRRIPTGAVDPAVAGSRHADNHVPPDSSDEVPHLPQSGKSRCAFGGPATPDAGVRELRRGNR